MTRRNVVLVCTDQWRGDALSILGGHAPRTQFLDQLARSGALATRAYSPAPTCVPARMSLLTGLEPSSHGRVGYEDGLVFDAGVTMAEAFRDGGYQAQAIGKMHVHPPRNRAGFDNVILHDGYLHATRRGRPDPRFHDDYAAWLTRVADNGAFADEYENGAHCNAAVAMPWDRPEYQHPTNWATDEAIDWLYRRDPDRPFFLFLSYHRPHAPYNPPSWAFDMYRDEQFPPAPIGNWEGMLEEFRDDHSPEALVATYPEAVRRRALAGYYGNMTHIDIQIKRFMEALSDFGVAEDTVVCFTSDHGDMMGDHGMWRKGYPYEGSARIPMIFAGPGVSAGTRADTLMDLTDVPATLLDLAGLPVPEQMDSRSHADVLRRGAGEVSGPRDHLHGEHAILGQSLQWIIRGHHKYVWWSGAGTEQLFDLHEDPDELVDLVLAAGAGALLPAHEGALHDCRALLVRELEGRPEGYVQDGGLIAGRPAVTYLGHAVSS